MSGEDQAPPMPKMDIKMFIVLPVLYFSRKIDFTNPEILRLVTNIFIGGSSKYHYYYYYFNLLFILYYIDFSKIVLYLVVVFTLSVYYYIFTQINSKKDETKIWIPPKPLPQIPFLNDKPPAKPSPKDYEATTYKDHEMKVLKETVQSIIFSAAMTYLFSVKFNVHMSLLVQSIMVPLNLYESVLFKKFLLGSTKQSDGNNLYNELLKEPTEEPDKKPIKGDDKKKVGVIEKDEPRVVELDETKNE